MGTYRFSLGQFGWYKTFTILEQNYDGNANTPTKLREDDYTGLTHFIVPDFADDSVDLTDIKEVKATNVNLTVQLTINATPPKN